MITDTSKRILEYIRSNRQARVVELARVLGLTKASVHRQLNKLVEQEKIMKMGKPPVVFYVLREKEDRPSVSFPQEVGDFIDENYVYVSPAGEMLIGVLGFTRWVRAVNQEKYLLSLANEYVKVRKDANGFITSYGWVDATEAKEKAVFEENMLNKLIYKDFYSLEKFGKTRLGQMVMYAKMSQNIRIIDAIVEQIKPTIEKIIEVYKIDTIVYIPPSIKREVQLMTELRAGLRIHLSEIALVKAYAGDVVVSQKSLSKLQERVVNARDTIFIDFQKSPEHPKNVLIIDDAVGSGATLHETAKKIQHLLQPGGHIIGFAIVGSMKGFEVIREI